MLDAAVLSSIRDLEFVARAIVDGALSGLHRSPFHGYSAEFSQYRHYRAGDDLKYVDWKLLARTDRLYTKQFRETTNVRMQIVLDASRSMGFGDPVTKLGVARLVTAALAHLIAGQGDAPGLTVYDERVRTYLASRPGRSHLRLLLATIASVTPAGQTKPASAVRRAADLLRSRGALVLMSDLYEDEDGVAAELRRAVRIGHDVSVFHVLAPEELAWSWREDLEAVDSETGRRVLASAAMAAGYRRRMDAFLQRWRERCASEGIAYVLARTDEAPAHTLRAYLLKRRAGRA